MGEIIDNTKGKIKQAVGDLTGDEKLKREGELDVAKGKAEGAIADVKAAATDAGNAIKDAVKK